MKKTMMFFMVLVIIGAVSLTEEAWAQTKSYKAQPYTPSKTVFISSQVYVGNLGGINGADQLCQRLASTAGLSGTYKAWLAASTTQNPLTRFTHSKGPYKLRNGVIIANNWDELWTMGKIMNPINIDENGRQVIMPQSDPFGHINVWTGMRYKTGTNGGGWVTYLPYNCVRWYKSDATQNGLSGFFYLKSLPNNYDIVYWGGGRGNIIGGSCSEAKHIYCFQQ